MRTRYRVTLEKAEREQLIVLTTTGKASARKIIHARALLLCDVGPHAEGKVWRVVDVAAALGVSERTIEHIKERFVEEGLDAALVRRPNLTPRESIFDGRFEAELIALACSPAPEGRVRWTIRLLAQTVVALQIVPHASPMLIHKTLKKTSYVLT
jgi:hypothetical protein